MNKKQLLNYNAKNLLNACYVASQALRLAAKIDNRFIEVSWIVDEAIQNAIGEHHVRSRTNT